MNTIEPKIFVVASTATHEDQITAYLEHVGVPSWTTDAPSNGEKLVEMMGRLCYRSWAPGLNPNVTKVRQGNSSYISNILKSKHGSVLEHGSVSFIFADVSRVFTHELVRHRVGTAMSQESLRFVRLNNIKFWMPTVIQEDDHAMQIFSNAVEHLEELQKHLSDHFSLNDENSFAVKKEITSAMRRIAPDGLATTIGWTANFRTLRNVIEMRTAPSAEEEIRLVFNKVAEECHNRFPNIFSDMQKEAAGKYNRYFFENSKA